LSIVVDASVALTWLLPGEDTSLTLQLRDRASDKPQIELLVPSNFWCEVSNTLWVAVRRDRITRPLAMEALESLIEFHFIVWAPDPVSVLSLSFEQNIAAYDSAYLSLALEHGSTLWTLDKALIEAAGRLNIPVEPFSP
jgi:predicted nucleic acid-binding protein